MLRVTEKLGCSLILVIIRTVLFEQNIRFKQSIPACAGTQVGRLDGNERQSNQQL